MKKLNKDNFSELVLNSKEPVLVDFWSEVCFQCIALEPTIKKLEVKYPKIKFYSANIGELSDIAGKFGIMALPTVLIFSNGQIIHQLCGNLPQNTFEKELDKF